MINKILGNYSIISILGENINQARTTYIASDGKGEIVLKEFRFNTNLQKWLER